MGFDYFKSAASSHADKAYRQFFDTAASELDLSVIGDAECMNMLNKLFSRTNINYRNLPAALLEIDRTLRKYGAQTIDEAQEEAEREEAEAAAEESNAENEDAETEPKDYELDDGDAYKGDS